MERVNPKERLHVPQTHSLSTSPEDSRTSFGSGIGAFRQRNAGLAASIAAGLKNPFSGSSSNAASAGTPVSSSPPTTRGDLSGAKKKLSQVENMVSALTPGGMAVTWGNNTYLESVRDKWPSTVSYPGSSYSDEEMLVGGRVTPAGGKVEGIAVNVYNQGTFDDEGCLVTGLLDFDENDSGYSSLNVNEGETKPSKAFLTNCGFESYRHAYADILFAWERPFTRLEILKFNSMPNPMSPAPLPHEVAKHDSFSTAPTTVSAPPAPSTKKPPLISRQSHTSTKSMPPLPRSGNISPMTGSPYAAGQHTLHPKNRAVSHVSLPHPVPPPGRGPEPESETEDKKPQATQSETGYGLSITGYCLKHESRLEPLVYPAGTTSATRRGGAVGRCDRCDIIKSKLRCVVCIEPVAGGYVACLNCGCVTHCECAEAYFGSDSTYASSHFPQKAVEGAPSEAGSRAAKEIDPSLDCPAGCDCKCTRDANNGVVESWEVMMGALEQMREKERQREAAEEARRLRKSSRNNSGASTPRGQAKSKGSGRRVTAEWDDDDAGMGRDWEDAGAALERTATQSTTATANTVRTVESGYASLSRRLGQVRAAEGWVRRKGSSLRNGEL